MLTDAEFERLCKRLGFRPRVDMVDAELARVARWPHNASGAWSYSRPSFSSQLFRAFYRAVACGRVLGVRVPRVYVLVDAYLKTALVAAGGRGRR